MAVSPMTSPVSAVKRSAKIWLMAAFCRAMSSALGVDVDAGGVAGAEEERRDGEDAGAGAEVEHLLTALNGALQLAHAHLRGGMRAGAEDHAGVEQDDDAVVRVFGVEPFRHDKQLLADGERLIILFPVVFPVFVADVGERPQASRSRRRDSRDGGRPDRREAC